MKAVFIDQIVEFVRSNHPYAGHWSQTISQDWIAFFMVNDLIAIVSEDGDTIDGLVLFRTVMTPEEGADESQMNYDPEGNVVWIDFCYATSKDAMAALGICVIHRIGERGTIAWARGQKLSVWSVKHFKEKLYGTAKSTTT